MKRIHHNGYLPADTSVRALVVSVTLLAVVFVSGQMISGSDTVPAVVAEIAPHGKLVSVDQGGRGRNSLDCRELRFSRYKIVALANYNSHCQRWCEREN